MILGLCEAGIFCSNVLLYHGPVTFTPERPRRVWNPLRVRRELPSPARTSLMALSFLLPLAIWCIASYGPFWPEAMELDVSGEAAGIDSIHVAGERMKPEYLAPFQAAVRAENAQVTAARQSGQPMKVAARANKKIVRQIFPVALASGWVTRAQETDDDKLRALWLDMAAGRLQPNKMDWTEENLAILKDGAAKLSNPAAWPEEALLKLVPQGRVVQERPVFLIPPHQVVLTGWEDWNRAPVDAGEVAADGANSKSAPKTLRQRYGESLKTIFCGFMLAALIAIPLGILAGTYDLFSRLLEPFTDFFRYMPAPVFGVVLMAIFGLEFAPKVMLVFLGTLPSSLLVIANTTRSLDGALLEAAQTLGANQRQLLSRVVVPGILPNLYNDLRIQIGCAWTWLVIAELLGFKSGLTEIIDTRGRRFQFEHVYPAILMIGFTGFFVDQVLAWLSRGLFPYAYPTPSRISHWFVRTVSYVPRRALRTWRQRADLARVSAIPTGTPTP